MKNENKYVWLEYCPFCKRRHRVSMQPCPSCNIYFTPQPISDKVYEQCGADYDCEGCIAYRDHTNPY